MRNMFKPIFNICDFGAVGDGVTLNTQAIADAVTSCNKSGGGIVLVPSGVFLSGSIELLSNVTLYISEGATLKSTSKASDHPFIGFIHNEMGETTSFIWAMNQENLQIVGGGVIDINAREIYPDNCERYYGAPIEKLSEKQKSEATFAKNNERVNQPVFFESCSDICVSDIKVKDSSCWSITFSRSSRIKVHNISVDNNLNYQNNDGVHISACKDVSVTDCDFSCADDCIAMTCITSHEGENDRIYIRNCIMRTRSAGIRIGDRSRNIIISDINIYDTNRGIGIFTEVGGYIADVSITNIILHTHIFGGVWWGKGEALVICAAAENSFINHVSVSNMLGSCENGILCYGNNNNISKVSLNNIMLTLKTSENNRLFGGLIDCRPYAWEKTDASNFDLFVKNAEAPNMSNVSICFD